MESIYTTVCVVYSDHKRHMKYYFYWTNMALKCHKNVSLDLTQWVGARLEYQIIFNNMFSKRKKLTTESAIF